MFISCWLSKCRQFICSWILLLWKQNTVLFSTTEILVVQGRNPTWSTLNIKKLYGVIWASDICGLSPGTQVPTILPTECWYQCHQGRHTAVKHGWHKLSTHGEETHTIFSSHCQSPWPRGPSQQPPQGNWRACTHLVLQLVMKEAVGRLDWWASHHSSGVSGCNMTRTLK